MKDFILGNNIRIYRRRLNISQSKLGQHVGVSKNTISSIERGEFQPTAKLALKLCQAFGLPFSELFFPIYK